MDKFRLAVDHCLAVLSLYFLPTVLSVRPEVGIAWRDDFS
jgi:hypothetical protein